MSEIDRLRALVATWRRRADAEQTSVKREGAELYYSNGQAWALRQAADELEALLAAPVQLLADDHEFLKRTRRDLMESVRKEQKQIEAIAAELKLPPPTDRQGYEGKHNAFTVIAALAEGCICRTTRCQHGAHLHHNGVCEVCNAGICWC